MIRMRSLLMLCKLTRKLYAQCKVECSTHDALRAGADGFQVLVSLENGELRVSHLHCVEQSGETRHFGRGGNQRHAGGKGGAAGQLEHPGCLQEDSTSPRPGLRPKFHTRECNIKSSWIM